MKKVSFIILLVSILLVTKSQNLDWSWTIVSEGSGEAYATNICIDSDKNVFVLGLFEGELILATDTFTSAVGDDIFLAKFDSSGHYHWATTINSSHFKDRGDLTVDSQGNVYITFSFSNSITINDITLNSDKIKEGFYAKYNSSGKLLWVKKIHSGRTLTDVKLKSDRNNNIYIGGNFTQSVTIGEVSVSTLGDEYTQMMFYSKLDSAGNCLWLKRALMTPGWDAFGFKDMDVGPQGNGYVSGTLMTTSDFGDGVILECPGEVPFIVKYDSSGKCLWGFTAASTLDKSGFFQGFGETFDICATDSGKLYITGMYVGGIIFDDDTLWTFYEKMEEIFLAELDTTGNYLQSVSFGSLGDGGDFGLGIEFGGTGEGYLLGLYGDTLIMNQDTLIAIEDTTSTCVSSNVFISSLDENLNPIWAKSAGLQGDRQFGEIVLGFSNDIFLAGYKTTVVSKKGVSAIQKKIFVGMKGSGITPSIPLFSWSELKPPLYIANITCPGGSDGVITYYINEGTYPPYNYWLIRLSEDTIASGVTGNNVCPYEYIDSLSQGIYEFKIQDSQGNILSRFVSVIEPPPIITGSISGPLDVLESSTDLYTVNPPSGFYFEWNVNGGTIIEGQGTDSVTIQWGAVGSGIISVLKIDQSGCTGDTATLEVSIGSTDITDASTQVLQIYPNPFYDELIINLPNSFKYYEVKITDITGRVQFLKHYSIEPRIKIPTNTLKQGIYILKLTGSEIHQQLIIKQ